MRSWSRRLNPTRAAPRCEERRPSVLRYCKHEDAVRCRPLLQLVPFRRCAHALSRIGSGEPALGPCRWPRERRIVGPLQNYAHRLGPEKARIVAYCSAPESAIGSTRSAILPIRSAISSAQRGKGDEPGRPLFAVAHGIAVVRHRGRPSCGLIGGRTRESMSAIHGGVINVLSVSDSFGVRRARRAMAEFY